MRPATARPFKLVITAAIGAALTLAACGDDGDSSGGGSTEAFCEELETFASNTDENDDTFLADFKKVADAAPSEISAAMNQMLAAFESLDALPDEPETEEQMTEMMEVLEAIDEPADAVEEFALANCPDLPPSVFGG